MTDILRIPHRTLLIVCTAAALIAAGAVAVAQQTGDTTQSRLATSAAVTPKATSSTESSAFGVLASSGAAVPDAVTDAFSKSPQYDGAFAPNPALAKALPQTNPYTNTSAWLVPGDDGLCLYVPDTEGAGITCNTLDEAKGGKLHLVLTPFGDPAYVVGVVPDGTTAVTAIFADGSEKALEVRDNSYAIRSSEVRQIAVGPTRFSVPQAPKLPPKVS
jgi:hypothetical protein